MCRLLWIKGVCSSWETCFPITPVIVRKPNRHSQLSHKQSARPKRRHWTPAILAQQRWPHIPDVASSLTLRLAVIPIIPSLQQRFTPLPDSQPEEASAQVKMAYKLKTVLGKAIYGARTCTVELVIGIIKEVLGFRQFSLRGTQAAAGDWRLVCLAFNLKRFHTLSWA
jgi:hypothetical protein